VSANITIVPTLATMAGIYGMPRGGGASSPRFHAYHALVAHTFGLSAFNPMAGPHALEAVDALLAMNGEAIVADAARETALRCRYDGDVTLALVVASPGMWTDRIATTVRHRTLDTRIPNHGLVFQWTHDVPTPDSVHDAAVAEMVRVIHTEQHGPATSVRAVLAREGKAIALGKAAVPPLGDAERRAVDDALDIIGDSSNPADIVAIALGDEVAIAMGYPTLGLAPDAGVRWAATSEAIALA